MGRHYHRQKPGRNHRRPQRPALRARWFEGRPRQSQGSHSRQRQPQVRFGEEGRAHQLLHGRRQGSHSRELRSAPRDRRSVLRPQGLYPHQPARRHAGGRLPGMGVGRRRRAGVGAPAAVGAQTDHREKYSRLHAARLRTLPARPPTAAICNCACRAMRSSARSSRVSTLLDEFGITQEQYRDVVYKQYVKKFGKLGDAVVQSNMEVMTQGFEQVKEIKIGALAAADRSSLRGQALLPILELATAGGSCGTRLPLHAIPAGQGPRTPYQHASPHSTRSSARTSATTSRPRRSPPWASSPRPPATLHRNTSPAAKPRSTSPRTARSAWSASPSARTPRCPTARRI